MQKIEAILYSCSEEAFNKDFYKISTKINVFSIYFPLTNAANVYNITLKHFVNVLIYTISINAIISIIYLNNIIIIHSDYE